MLLRNLSEVTIIQKLDYLQYTNDMAIQIKFLNRNLEVWLATAYSGTFPKALAEYRATCSLRHIRAMLRRPSSLSSGWLVKAFIQIIIG